MTVSGSRHLGVNAGVLRSSRASPALEPQPLFTCDSHLGSAPRMGKLSGQACAGGFTSPSSAPTRPGSQHFSPQPAHLFWGHGPGPALQGLTAWSFFAAISTKMIERIFSGAVTRYVPTHCFLVFPLMTVAGFLCLS